MRVHHHAGIWLLMLLVGAGFRLATTWPAPRPQVLDADLLGDGRVERVVLDPSRDPSLSVWRGGRRLWQGVPRRWRPWKLRIADVDGDGRGEIAVGVQKATHFFPHPHRCLFLYSFDGKAVNPKWLGSSLSRPFTDFAFTGQGKGRPAKLVAIETRRDGRQCVAVYSWEGFGFSMDWQRGAWKNARLLEVGHARLLVVADSRRWIVRR